MRDKFILTITEHRYLGWILVPVLIERNNQSFITIKEQASVQLFNHEGYDFTEGQKKIIKSFEKISDHNLMTRFSTEKVVADFYNKTSAETFEERLRPYVESQLKAIIHQAIVNKEPIYNRPPGYQNLYESDRIEIISSNVNAVFNFEKSEENFKYYLTINYQDKILSLLNKNIITLVNKPGIVINGHQLFSFTDVDAKKLMPFTQKKHIEIPPSSLERYMESFVLNAIRNQQTNLKGIAVEHINPTGTAHLFLEEDLEGDPILVLKFKYGKKYFDMKSTSIKEVSFVKEDKNYKFLRFERNKADENKILSQLNQRGLRAFEPGVFKLPDYVNGSTENLYLLVEWINRNTDLIEGENIEIHQKHYEQNFYSDDIRLDTQFKDDNDWFELHGFVYFGGFKIPFVNLRKYIISGTREFTLPNGIIAILPIEWFAKYRELFKFAEDKAGKLRLGKHHFNLLLNSDIQSVDMDKIRAAYDFNPSAELSLPHNMNAQLRAYQKVGYSWMTHLQKNGFGGCLADDMGLGKTLQTLTMLQKIYQEAEEMAGYSEEIDIETNQETEELLNDAIQQDMAGESEISRPSPKKIQKLPATLIIMPKSLLHNWANEIRKFCPDLLLYIYGGNRRLKTKEIGKIFRHYNIVLTSYGLMRNDIVYLENYEFQYLILDESHFIKNPSSKAYQAVMDVKAKHRLAISGTPIETRYKTFGPSLISLIRGY